MVQTIRNHRPYNYCDYRKMITFLRTQKLVKNQLDELNRIDTKPTQPNVHEIKFIKRLICEVKAPH